MDYEKAYKDALEKARIFKEHLIEISQKGFADEMEYIFPELAESEDERIRKEIIDFILDNETDEDNDINCWLAWLEKQGEQKVPINDFKAKDWYVSKVDGKIHDMTYNPNNKVEHPKWTKEDEERLQSCISSLQGKGLMGGVDTINTKWLKLLKQRMEE